MNILEQKTMNILDTKTLDMLKLKSDTAKLPTFSFTRKAKWVYAPTGNFLDVSIYICHAPNLFQRVMTRIFFGVRWKRCS